MCTLYRLIKMKNDRLIKIIFLEEILGARLGWYSDLNKVCTSINFKLPGDLSHTIKLSDFTKKCQSYHISKWKELVIKQTKLKLYNDIIDNYGNKEFLNGILLKEERSLLCQLLCGNLKINIELGHYRNKPLNKRTCGICNGNAVEDCYHFLFECEALIVPHTIMSNRLKAKNVEVFNVNNRERYIIYCITMYVQKI